MLKLNLYVGGGVYCIYDHNVRMCCMYNVCMWGVYCIYNVCMWGVYCIYNVPMWGV